MREIKVDSEYLILRLFPPPPRVCLSVHVSSLAFIATLHSSLHACWIPPPSVLISSLFCCEKSPSSAPWTRRLCPQQSVLHPFLHPVLSVCSPSSSLSVSCLSSAIRSEPEII